MLNAADLRYRVLEMCQAWNYTPDEIAQAFRLAEQDPSGWVFRCDEDLKYRAAHPEQCLNPGVEPRRIVLVEYGCRGAEGIVPVVVAIPRAAFDMQALPRFLKHMLPEAAVETCRILPGELAVNSDKVD